MGTINSSDRIAATLYSLGTFFVSGIYVLIPCIKEIVVMMMTIIIIIIYVEPETNKTADMVSRNSQLPHMLMQLQAGTRLV
jgi:hypothetical protein